MSRVASLTMAFLIGLSMTASAANEVDSIYFSRNTRYTLLKEKVVLVERDRPGMVTMDEWSQLVFLSANGEHNVDDLISVLGRQYQGGAPLGMAEQTRVLVRDLAQRGHIVLHDQRRKLPYYLAIPVEQQDKERAKTFMEADGFIEKAGK